MGFFTTAKAWLLIVVYKKAKIRKKHAFLWDLDTFFENINIKYNIYLQKINNFFATFLKKLLHFCHLYSIIVMLRGEKAHESV